jgi:hypothetical protein
LANSVGGTTTTDSSAAAWEQATLGAAEASAQDQADAESAARSKAEADAAAAAAAGTPISNAPLDGNDGFGPPASERALDAFYGHDPRPQSAGAASAPPNSVSPEEAQQLRKEGFIVNTDEFGNNTVPPQTGNDTILQGPSYKNVPAPSTSTTSGGDPEAAGGGTLGGPEPTPGSTAANPVSEPADKPAPGKFVSGLGPEVDNLLNLSPTLQKLWQKAHSEGWQFQAGHYGKRSNADPNDHVIRINLDDAAPGADRAGRLASLISHEIGHAANDLQPIIEAPNKSDFVAKNTELQLKQEGDAAFENARVRDEIIANGGPDIGIRGGDDPKYIAVYENFKAGKISEAEARSQMGVIQGQEPDALGDNPPSRKDNYEKNYGQYWDDHHPK